MHRGDAARGAVKVSAGALFDFRDVFLARIACAPTSLLDAFGDPALPDLALQALDLRRGFEADAERLTAALAAATPRGGQRRLRRAITRLRRASADPASFRARAAELEGAEGYSRIDEALQRACAAADAAIDAAMRFETAQARQLESEREALRAALQYEEIRKGILYSSDGLATQLDRYVAGAATWKPGRLRKLEETLITYVGRAVAKTSPFSTFTITTWGRWCAESGRASGVLPPPPPERRASVRLHRAALHRVLFRIIDARPLFSSLRLRPNPTLIIQDEIVFYRAEPRVEQGELRYMPLDEELVRLPRQPAIEAVLQHFAKAGGECTIGELLDELVRQSSTGRSDLERYIAHLVDMQLLEIRLPAPEHDLEYDRAVAEWLARNPEHQARRVGTELENVVRALEPFADADSRTRHEIQRDVEQRWRGIERALGLKPTEQVCFFEDVGRTGAEVGLDRSLLDEVREDLWSLGTLSAVFQPIYRVRARIAQLLYDVHGGEAPLLEVFKSYEDARRSGAPPGQMEKELDDLRSRIRAAVRSAVLETEAGRVVDWRRVLSILSPLPAWIDSPPSMGFFLQRGRAPGAPWIVNLPVDGTGRFYSRFLHLFPELQNVAATRGDGAQPDAEIVDLGGVFAFNVNLHVPLTRRALDYPGHTHRDDWASVRLSELVVRLDAAGIPRLTPRDGGPDVMPVHFGFLVSPWLPMLARFLASFGPIGPKALPWHEDIFPGAARMPHVPRLFWGHLLLYRERWNLFPDELEPIVHGTALDAFAAVGALRRARGMPRRGFVTVDRMERQAPIPRRQPSAEGGSNRMSRRAENLGRKPHFIDLTSPLFLPRLRRLAGQAMRQLTVEEVYPALHGTLAFNGRDNYAVELFTEIPAPGS